MTNASIQADQPRPDQEQADLLSRRDPDAEMAAEAAAYRLEHGGA